MKTCTKCQTEKPLTDFSPSKQTRDGRSAWCRVCTNAQRKERYANDPTYKARMKAKANAAYHAEGEYRESVIERAREQSRKRTETGARKNDEQRAKQREWAKNKNPDDVRRWKREWHQLQMQTNPDYADKERNRSEEKRKRAYTTPEGTKRMRHYKARAEHVRRARRADAGTYTNAEWDQLCAACDHCCLCCGERRPLTVDHVVPLSKGGANTIENLQPLCLSCNDKKGTKTIDYRTYTGDSYCAPANEV